MDRLSSRFARRLRHRSRSASAAGAALVLAAAAIALAIVFGASAWRIAAATPAAAGPVPSPTHLIRLADDAASSWMLAIVAVVATLGFAAFLVAVSPGTRPRRVLADARGAVLVDDRVIARHLAARAAAAAGVAPANVHAATTHRTVDLRITPASGFPPDREALQESADAVLDALAPKPVVRARVRLAREGKVGAS